MMNKWQRALVITLFGFGFMGSFIYYIPAWLVGSLVSHYSQNRLNMSNEHGTFWRGGAMLYAQDSDRKNAVPLLIIGWKIKLGIKQFININFTASDQTIANASLTKNGLVVDNVNLGLSLDQLGPLLGNLNSLGLSGNVHLATDQITLGKKIDGTVRVNLDNVGSSIAPVNPIGSYQVTVNLADNSLNVNSNPDSVILVNGAGNFSSLMLSSRVQPNKKDQLLQFMTMMGIPQADGSYLMKVF